MKTTLTQAKEYVKLFSGGFTTKQNRHYNIRAYINALSYLGNNWVYAQQVVRKQPFKKLEK